MYSGIRLFKTAFMNTRRQIYVSGIFLVAITCVLTIILYLAESRVDPDFSFWDAIIWPYEKYLGDPGKVVDEPLLSPIGKLIGTIVGIMGVAIFAVPAGLIGSGLTDAMDEEKRDRHLEECRDRIRKSFRRFLNKKTQYRVTTRRIPVITMQAKKGITENDIIDTVMKFDEFRLRNLATSQTAAEHPQDRLVIEMLPLDTKTVDGFVIKRTKYGIKIDRGSLVNIIAPSAATENSIGHFAYYLAQFGGFNYVSREFITDVDEPVSYYILDGKETDWEQPLKEYISDIKELSADKEQWNIVLVSSDNVYDTQLHFVHRANEKSGLASTTLDEEKFMGLYADMAAKMQDEFGYLSDLDEKYKPVGKKNVGIITGGGTVNNAFTLRVSYSVTTWTDTPVPVIVEMAKVIKKHLEKPERSQFEEHPSWKKKGCGYGENELSKKDNGTA
jgi:voltage-gated potassium channel